MICDKSWQEGKEIQMEHLIQGGLALHNAEGYNHPYRASSHYELHPDKAAALFIMQPLESET